MTFVTEQDDGRVVRWRTGGGGAVIFEDAFGSREEADLVLLAEGLRRRKRPFSFTGRGGMHRVDGVYEVKRIS